MNAVQSLFNSNYFDGSIHYRGHGKLESSPAGKSILHVISHELGHVSEFRSKALREGAEVRSVDVGIHYEIRDGRLVATGGETRVTSAVKKDSNESKFQSETDRYDVEPIPSEEDILQDRIKKVQSEINTVLARALYAMDQTKSIDAWRDENKMHAFEGLKEALAKRLEELQAKEEQVFSETIQHKIISSQKEQKSMLLSLGLVPSRVGTSLNLLA
jgi:hypothetical protein